MPAERKHLTLANRQLSYLEASASGARLRGDVVLLHGFPLSAEMWTPQLDAVPEGWRFIAPDLGGFGQSTGLPSEAPSMDDDAADVVELLDRLEVETAVVGGLSMGGYVAFALLRRSPHRCRALILADTRPQADNDEGRAGRRRMLDLLDRGGPAAVADEMLPKLLGATSRTSHPELVEQIRALIMASTANRPEAIAGAIQRMMQRPDSIGQLSAIRCPTLIIVGAEDELTPPAESEAMQRQIPGSRLAVITGAGHLSNLERPDEFNEAIAGFLDDPRCQR